MSGYCSYETLGSKIVLKTAQLYSISVPVSNCCVDERYYVMSPYINDTK